MPIILGPMGNAMSTLEHLGTFVYTISIIGRITWRYVAPGKSIQNAFIEGSTVGCATAQRDAIPIALAARLADPWREHADTFNLRRDFRSAQ